MHAHDVGEIEFWWMQVLEKDIERIKGYDMFEGTSHEGMRGLRRIHVKSLHADAMEELTFNGCKSLKKIPEGLGGLTCFKELYMLECEGLSEFAARVSTLMALKESHFWWMQIVEDSYRRIKGFDMFE